MEGAGVYRGRGLPSAYEPFPGNTSRSLARLRYHVSKEVVNGTSVQIVELSPDRTLVHWAADRTRYPLGRIRPRLSTLLRWVFAQYDVFVMVQDPLTYLVSEKQWRQLIEPHLPEIVTKIRPMAALDVGAGKDIVPTYSNLFQAGVVATEIRWLQILHLRWIDGAKAIRTDRVTRQAVGGTFDCVFLLNVLDRAEDPEGLLADAAEVLNPGGVIIISLVLPVLQYSGWRIPVNGTTWKFCARQTLLWLSSQGWTPLSISRVPYLNSGSGPWNKGPHIYVLDAAFIVCRRAPASSGAVADYPAGSRFLENDAAFATERGAVNDDEHKVAAAARVAAWTVAAAASRAAASGATGAEVAAAATNAAGETFPSALNGTEKVQTPETTEIQHPHKMHGENCEL